MAHSVTTSVAEQTAFDREAVHSTALFELALTNFMTITDSDYKPLECGSSCVRLPIPHDALMIEQLLGL